MQNGGACLGKGSQIVQHSTTCTSAVDGHDPSADLVAFRQNVLKDDDLAVPMPTELGSTIKADLSDVARVGKKAVEKCQLILPLVSKLRM